jgi:hypothetical protein
MVKAALVAFGLHRVAMGSAGYELDKVARRRERECASALPWCSGGFYETEVKRGLEVGIPASVLNYGQALELLGIDRFDEGYSRCWPS